jgi:hypothetical protein
MVVDSRIDAVKVYHRGAMVTRTLSVSADGGQLPAQVEIRGLPLSLQDATVRLAVRGAEGGGEVVAADLRVGLVARADEELVEPPDSAALKAAERAARQNLERTSQLQHEIALLSQIPIPGRPTGKAGEPPPPSPLEARVALERFTDGAVVERQQDLVKLLEEQARLQEEVAHLRDKLARATAAKRARPDRVSKVVVATLRRSGVVTAAQLELSYFVPGCRWAPRYQCRVARDGASARLVTRALVAQDTGEDWVGVKLTLSTAAPLRWTELPKLSSIRIGKAQPPSPDRGFRAPPSGGEVLFEDWRRDTDRLRAAAPARLPDAPGLPLFAEEPDLDALLALPVHAADKEGATLDRFMAGGAVAGAAMSSLMGEDDEVYADMAMEMEEPAPEAVMAAPPPAPRMEARARRYRAPAAERSLKKGRVAPEDRSPEPAGPPAFGLLRLSGPAQSGALRPADPRGDYRSQLAQSGLVVDFDPAGLVSAAARRAEAVAGLSLPDGAADVRQAAANFDYAYPTAARVEVPSDGAFHSIPVDQRQAPLSLRYVVVPRVDTNVFREAAIENPSTAPLLPGAVEVYVGDEYVVTAALPAVAPRARFRLGLGVEQAIKCARNTHFSESRSGSAVVATAELAHDIAVTLVNGLGREILCEVRERIPQPAEGAEVVVEAPWTPYDQEERGRPLAGGRRWEVSVPAGGERALRARYVVKIYANNEVVGGNRREA